MKKLIMFSFILAVSVGMIYSAGITVNLPSGGPNYYKGTTHNITWTKTGSCTGSSIKINIFKNSVDPSNFVEQLTAGISATSKPWTIGMGYVTGTYIIRVKTDDNSCFGDSPTFSVTDAPSGSSILVTSPTASTDWCKGSSHNITWTSSLPGSTSLKINIFKNSIDPANFVEQLTSNNDGSENWAIGSGYDTGNYIIRIKTDDSSVTGDSAVFHIKSCSGGRVDWGRLKDILRGMTLIEWWRIHGPHPPWPDPCLSCPPEFDLGRLKEIMNEAGLKEQVVVELFKGGAKISELGKFGPKEEQLRGRVVRMKNMNNMRLAQVPMLQSRVVLKGLKLNNSKLLGTGEGYKLVFKNMKGEVIFEKNVKLQEKNLRGKRIR